MLPQLGDTLEPRRGLQFGGGSGNSGSFIVFSSGSMVGFLVQEAQDDGVEIKLVAQHGIEHDDKHVIHTGETHSKCEDDVFIVNRDTESTQAQSERADYIILVGHRLLRCLLPNDGGGRDKLQVHERSGCR